MITYGLKVVEKVKETDDAVTICFKQPGLKKIAYQAGQYLTVIFRINGRRYIRPYSFSSAPGIDATLNITVKRVLQGVVSNHIVDKVEVGDTIEVMPPMGDFVIDRDNFNNTNHVVLWGVGSGVTPLMSIAKFVLGNYSNHVTLVYGNRSHESTIFVSQIEQLKQQYSNFTLWNFHTKLRVNATNTYLVEGRIQPAKVLAVLNEVDQLKHSVHYVCGPLGLKESVKDELIKFDVDPSHIHSEDFEIVKDPKDFEDVITCTVEIISDRVSTQVEVIKGKSILEAGLDAGIELPYSCQTGSCLICKGKVVAGDVKTIGITHRPDKLLPGEQLLCCTYPLSEGIKVES
ncbi:ferredoxin--NADP reductase [Mucilaginibacter myungsuensis]|uniref:Ferredoxin--NADP reductase n=1 Tax=Mucilaginibacter myungsuensis TaxID=649104 RepID=A0A929PWT1_9SPHI|nr:ferredoxin--NADP reductase [Mucilaginibacter myungsuensis]MBE9662421.1 ferredoxin--NADP reductase [Mucilaginibacter myungsuensis]MDN3599142.1 ferredoxin--NADP reductase [Mucilaginibacter myungsuensis]